MQTKQGQHRCLRLLQRVIQFFSIMSFVASLQANPLDHWSTVNSGLTNSPNLNAVCFGNGQWTIVGSGGTILTSSNGLDWTQRSAFTSSDFGDIAYGNHEWVAIGDSMVAYSLDGTNWTSHPEPQFIFNDLYRGKHIAFGSNLWVATVPQADPDDNSTSIYSSVDGTNWILARASSGMDEFARPLYAGGWWMVPGHHGNYREIGGGIILRSRDGQNWEFCSVDYKQDVGLSGLASDGSSWMAVGGDGLYPILMSSADDLNWHFRSPPEAHGVLLCAAWGGGNWVVAGAGIFYLDRDQWRLASALEGDYYNDVAYGDGYWVAIGPSAKIRIAGPVIQFHSPTITPDNGVTWKLSGPSGWDYQVQSTTNLSDPNWSSFTNFTSTNETTLIFAPPTNDVPHFYRAVSP